MQRSLQRPLQGEREVAALLGSVAQPILALDHAFNTVALPSVFDAGERALLLAALRPCARLRERLNAFAEAHVAAPSLAVHVRRTDQFSTSCNRGSFTPAQCAQMELMTRPAQIGSSLALWLPPHSRVYIASDEPPAFFAPLRTQARRGRGRGLEGLLDGCGC